MKSTKEIIDYIDNYLDGFFIGLNKLSKDEKKEFIHKLNHLVRVYELSFRPEDGFYIITDGKNKTVCHYFKADDKWSNIPLEFNLSKLEIVKKIEL